MRTFDENLKAYHTLNAQNDTYGASLATRLREASTPKEQEIIVQESKTHFAEQAKLYEELGEEMVKIMGKKWYQFWK